MTRRALMGVVMLVLLLPSLSAEETWNIHAQASISSHNEAALEEVFLSMNTTRPEAENSDDAVTWTWWSWSDETASSWPDDDALYRRSTLDLNTSLHEGTVIRHVTRSPSLLTIDGEVKVVAADQNLRFVVFDLTVTPLVALSNQTLMYVVLTEDRAVDQHLRATTHLVRELRPEVAFSLHANNTTSMTALLSADHLSAAGVDLTEEPNGWSYTIAVFGGEEGADDSELLVLKHDRLPSPSLHVSSRQAWTPVMLSILALVMLVAIVASMRTRELAIPSLRATWSDQRGDQLVLSVMAGSAAFTITKWSVQPPWAFKGRPPRRSFKPHEQADLVVSFRQVCSEECHIETSVEIDEFGGWKQHVWLAAPPTTPSANEEE